MLGKKLKALLDSGANCSLLGGSSVDLVEHLGLRKGTVEGGIKTADGTPHTIKNYVRLPIVYNNRNDTLPMLLVPSLPDCVILGMNFWEKFGVKAVCCSLEDSLQFEEPQGATKPLTREQRLQATQKQKEENWAEHNYTSTE